MNKLGNMINSSNNALDVVLMLILDSLDIAIVDCEQLLQVIKDKNNAKAYALIASLLDRVHSLEQAQRPILDELEHSYSEELLDNIRDVLERIQSALQKSEQAQELSSNTSYNDETGLEDPLFLCDVQLQPLVRATKESFYYWGRVNKNPELRQAYYTHEYAQHRQNFHVASGEILPFQVTIIVLAYNKLNMSKCCVESILANTDFKQLNAQLILVDHASTDGTLEYFKSVPNAKVIHFKHNMLLTTLQMLPQFCRSLYYVHVANDTIVTKDWLNILLSCIKSDSNIAIACPATPNCANRQSVVPTNNCEDLINIAQYHNKLNPLLWHERAQVHPVIGIFNLDIVNKIGFWDPAIYTFNSCDRDYSCQARRAGFKQILCCDVYCYHAAHGNYSQSSFDIVMLGRELFARKNGINPCYLGMEYDWNLLNSLSKFINDQEYKKLQVSKNLTSPEKKTVSSLQEVNVLAVNCGVGDSPMQLKNILKRNGYRVKIFHLTYDSLVEIDSKPLADVFVYVPKAEFIRGIYEYFAGYKFDYVLTDKPQSLAKLSPEFLDAVASRMTDNGILAFNLKNELRVKTDEQIREFITTRQPSENWGSVSINTLNQLINILNKRFITKFVTPYESEYYNKDLVLSLIKQNYGNIKLNEYMPFFVDVYTFICQNKPKI